MSMAKGLYTEFPAITIGGATGDYFAICPVTSCKWAEYAVDSVVNGDGATGAVVISTHNPPKALDYTGLATSELNNDNQAYQWPIRIPATTTQIINSTWDRIVNSEKRVYVRIDCGAGNSCYVTLRFRIREIDVIPGPSVEVHPDHEHQMNIARSDKTIERLAKMGIPRRAIEE